MHIRSFHERILAQFNVIFAQPSLRKSGDINLLVHQSFQRFHSLALKLFVRQSYKCFSGQRVNAEHPWLERNHMRNWLALESACMWQALHPSLKDGDEMIHKLSAPKTCTFATDWWSCKGFVVCIKMYYCVFCFSSTMRHVLSSLMSMFFRQASTIHPPLVHLTHHNCWCDKTIWLANQYLKLLYNLATLSNRKAIQRNNSFRNCKSPSIPQTSCQ